MSPWCNGCNATAKRRRYRQLPPEDKARISEIETDRALRRNHGITRDEFNAMLAAQGGVCAICKRPPGAKRLAVDHSHDTGCIRALLCDWCNRSLGWVEGVGLPAVDEYLSRHA